MEALPAALFDLALAISALLLELVVGLVMFILGTGLFAKQTKGLSRVAYAGACLVGLYLLTAVLRGFVPVLAQPGLNPVFAWPLLVIAVVVSLVLVAIPKAISRIETVQTGPKAPVVAERSLFMLHLLAYAIVIFGLAIWSSGYKAPRLAERVCATLQKRDLGDLVDFAERGLDLAERLTKKEISDRFRCEKPSEP